MQLTIAEALQQGIESHKAGKLQEADRLYTAILKIQPEHPDANHNLGILAVQLGKLEAALPLFERALQAEDQVERYWLSYLEILIKLGRTKEAQSGLDQAMWKGIKSNTLKNVTQLLQESSKQPIIAKPLQQEAKDQQAVKLMKADQFYSAILDAQPQQPDANHNLGVMAVQHGKVTEALLFFERALQANHKVEQYWLSYLDALLKLGKLQEAAKTLKQARGQGFTGEKWVQLEKQIKARAEAIQAPQAVEPPEAQLRVLQDLHFQGKPQAVLEQANQLLKSFPNSALLHVFLGVSTRALGQPEQAAKFYQQAIHLRPGYADSYNNLGNVQLELGDVTGAEQSYRQALELKPDYVEAHFGLGNILYELGDVTGAEQSYRQALELKPDYVEAHFGLGNILYELGDVTGAEQSYRQALELKPDHAVAHRHLSRISTYDGTEPQLQQILLLLDHPQLNISDRIHLSFALAKIYEDLGQFAQAFEHYQRGNELRRAELRYEIAAEEQQFLQLQEWFQQVDWEGLTTTDSVGSTSQIPIFILGMPRSGTTLVEQILSSHSNVFGGGELDYLSKGVRASVRLSSPLNKDILGRLRENYLTPLQTLKRQEHFVTDKMPQNFWWIGLICLALPEAKIIHVQRNPMVTCWSIYQQYLSKGHGYGCSLQDLGRYYQMYQEMMEYWREQFPQQIYELSYEQLTEGQEQQTRALLAHVGLAWEERCLEPEKNQRFVGTASDQMVRKKVYQGSSECWKNYEPFLNELTEMLLVEV